MYRDSGMKNGCDVTIHKNTAPDDRPGAEISARSAHRMSAGDIAFVVEQIRSHQGPKFGWVDVERISERISPSGYTRQALMVHPQIYSAYVEKKSALFGRRTTNTVEQSLKAKVAGLQSALQRLRLKIVRYQINAARAGLSVEYLDRPLPQSHSKQGLMEPAERRRLDMQQQKRIDAQRKRAPARV
jgi:hypothetical protein